MFILTLIPFLLCFQLSFAYDETDHQCTNVEKRQIFQCSYELYGRDVMNGSVDLKGITFVFNEKILKVNVMSYLSKQSVIEWNIWPYIYMRLGTESTFIVKN